MKRYVKCSDSTKHRYNVFFTTYSGYEDCEEVHADSAEDAYEIIWYRYADIGVIPDEIFVEEIGPEEGIQ